MTVRPMSGVVIIAGEPFFLATDPQTHAPLWHPQPEATQPGDPTMPNFFRWKDWSRGMGDSRGIFSGAVEHTSNAFLGKMGRILPGPKVTEIATNHDAPVTAFVEVTAPAARIIAFGGRYGAEIDPAAQTVSTTKDFGAGATVLGATLFIDQVAIAMGDSVDFQRRSAAGSYSANSITLKARAFGLTTGGDLLRAHGATRAICSAADFYGTGGNWSSEIPIGDASGNINQLFGHNQWEYHLKDEGFYSFDATTSQEVNILPDLAGWKSAENRNFFQWYDRVFLCTYAGLYRYVQQGGARTVGTEEMELNESVLRNCYPTAGAAFGKWGYVAFYDGTTSYICMIRNAASGDANFGSPFTVVSVIDSFAGPCRAMRISSAPTAPTLYYGAKNGSNYTVRYLTLTRDGLPSVFRDSGTCQVDLSPTDLGTPTTMKYFRALDFIGRNLSAARALQLSASIDGSAFNNVGAPVTALTATAARRFWTRNSNDSGKVIQLRTVMGLDSPTTPPEGRDIMLSYEERPEFVEGAQLTLRLRDQDREGDVSSRKSAQELHALIRGFLDTLVEVTDVYGETYTAAFARRARIYSSIQGNIDFQYPGGDPQESIELSMRRLDYA